MKYIKYFEKVEIFEEDWEEIDPNEKQIHNGIMFDDGGVFDHYKFIMLEDEEINPGDLVVYKDDKYWKGEFGPAIQRVYGVYGRLGNNVSFCIDGYDDVESDYQEPKKDLCKIKLIK